jgi:DNA-binding transcriptional MerR regulator
MDDYLSIGKVAKKLGLNPKTIRFYEETGLIPHPERRKASWASAGQRIFTKKAVDRLTFIKQARLLDLSLNQIKELLDAIEEGCCSSSRPHLRALLEAKLLEVNGKIQALKSLRTNLKGLHQRTLEVELISRKATTCGPTQTESECVFVEPPVHIGQGSKQMVKNSKKGLTFQSVEGLESNLKKDKTRR